MAEFDPSKVKPGDTVTVRVEPNPVTGWGTLDHGPEAIEVTGKVWLDSGDNPHGPVAKVGVHALGLPNVTLTDHQPAPEPDWDAMAEVIGDFECAACEGDFEASHSAACVDWERERAGTQPAPEPEPEWKPGTPGTATLNNRVSGISSPGLRAMRTVRDGVYGFALENGLSIADDATTYSVTGFVPDEPRPLPTRGQVKAALEPGWARDSITAMADAVLALLRGESR
jgi:hypothetical protein